VAFFSSLSYFVNLYNFYFHEVSCWNIFKVVLLPFYWVIVRNLNAYIIKIIFLLEILAIKSFVMLV